jgi:hypothetical protein
MNTVCTCGIDCADFIHQHAIQSNAIFSCPVCDTSLVAQRMGGSVSSDPGDFQGGISGPSGDDSRAAGLTLGT